MSTSVGAKSPSKKRKRTLSQSTKPKEEISLEERLKEALQEANILFDQNAQPISVSKAEELIITLVKGLHASDAQMIDQVLETSNQETVKSAVQRLPVKYLLPLVRELTKRVRSKYDVRIYIQWLHFLLTSHATYMASVPEIVDELNSQYEFFASSTEVMDRMLRLQGRLNLLLDQTADTKHSTESRQLSDQASKAIFIDGGENEVSDDDNELADEYIRRLLGNDDEFLAIDDGEWKGGTSENGDSPHDEQDYMSEGDGDGGGDVDDGDAQINGYPEDELSEGASDHDHMNDTDDDTSDI